MRDPSLRRVVHVDAHRFVGEVGLRHRGRDLPLLLVRQLDATDHFVEINLLLVAKGVDPCIRRYSPVRQDVDASAAHVLLVQLEGPLDLDLLHAAVFGLTLDVRGGQAEALVRVKVVELPGRGVLEVVPLRFPLVADVHHQLGLLLQEALRPLVRWAADRHLGGTAEEDAQL
jgi:hypothetical protein